METWNEFFDKKDEVKEINEHHKETKEEQVEWICSILPNFSDDAVKKIYDFIEQENMTD